MRPVSHKARAPRQQYDYAYYVNDIKDSGVYRIALNTNNESGFANVTIYFYSQPLTDRFEQKVKQTRGLGISLAINDPKHDESHGERARELFPHAHVFSASKKKEFSADELKNIVALVDSRAGIPGLNKLAADYTNFLEGKLTASDINQRECQSNQLPENTLYRYFQTRFKEKNSFFGISRDKKLEASRALSRHLSGLAGNSKRRYDLFAGRRHVSGIAKELRPALEDGRLKGVVDEYRKLKL